MQATVGGRRSDVDARKEGLPWRPRFSAQHPQPRVGLGLLPFFLACAVYLLVQRSVDQPSRVSALLKSLPVLYLAGLLGTAHPGGGYRSLLQAALLCSAVGDACLVWPEAFLHGMAAFSLAHLLYLWAFGLTPLKPGLLLPVLLVFAPYFGFLLPHFLPHLVWPLLVYSTVLVSMLWRALARGESARWGALLFLFSDAVLAWNTFFHQLPHGHLLVMTTYYLAQMLIALSAFQSPRLKSH
ncbi:lysoplasmalogenase TMEM86B isoform 1-T1 [Dama dama]|uniref:lysoplasmalogenase TMEM86B isoform X1 n=1 Tax=Dama dama TaxID=30532 RepID=UPI002A36193E|nr:lysoplasmalogenase TMEM86B isoform X1 [Dama dama]